MIIVRLQGGLGNQLFQYAMGYFLEKKHGTQVKYDFEYFDKRRAKGAITHWQYELDKFGISLDRSRKTEIMFYKLLHKLFPKGSYIVRESECEDFPRLNELGRGYFDGYWPSEQCWGLYSHEIVQNIRNGYGNASSISYYNEQIQNEDSVSIHVRRGDFLHQKVDAFLDNPVLYYQYSIERMKNKIDYPSFYCFSDDLDWAREHLEHLANIEFVDINKGEDSYRDLILMSNCKHNIIANSTFSWWASYLNTNSEKIVIAPRNWPSKNSQYMVCHSWEFVD